MTELFTLVNDDLVPAAQASLLVTDLSIQRGYGVFDFFKTLGHAPVFLEDHLSRFWHSAGRLRLDIGKTKPQLRDLIDILRNKNRIADSGIRLTLTGGYSPDGYTLARPNLIITQTPLSTPITPECQPGINLVTWPHQRQMPEAKTIDYLMAIWCQPMLKEKGAQDVLYHHNGIISECPRSNFFIVTADNALVTPVHNMLKGVIRGNVLQLARQEFRTEERDIHLDELQYAKEAFITSTTKHILPVTRIDDIVIGQQQASVATSVAQHLNTALYKLIEGYMTRTLILFLIFQTVLIKIYAQTEKVAAGVQKVTAGVPDKFTPYAFCAELPMKAALEKLPVGRLPFSIADIKITINSRGTIVDIPLADSEQLYGFGLQFGSFNQRGLKIRPLVNDKPLNDAGYTRGPATLYVSNKGYGILVNTARYTTFYCGNTVKSNAGASVIVDIPDGSERSLYSS